ncbi:MAG: FMN-binding protein [Pseudomonadales bacterium]
MSACLSPVGVGLAGAGLGLVAWAADARAAEHAYQSTESFIEESFAGAVPAARVLWLSPQLRETVRDVLGREPSLRVRYWRQAGRSAWVLDEIGKEQPITAGVLIRDGAIEDMRVLAFRESRGWEIRYPFFTSQFREARLAPDHALTRHIDGITGATLSVRAMDRMARVALLLDAQVRNDEARLARAD